MLALAFTGNFKRDVKRAEKRGKNLEKLWQAVEWLQAQEPLPARMRPHKLTGDWKDYWECHLEPDWLLVYGLEGKTLRLVGLGSHADLFR
jgi:mRNA interferase YafQ